MIPLFQVGNYCLCYNLRLSVSVYLNEGMGLILNNLREFELEHSSDDKVWDTALCEMLAANFQVHTLVLWMISPRQTYNFISLIYHLSFIKAD